MANENKNKDYLTTTEAARLLSVSPDTVLKWVKAGKVKSYRTLGGHFRIPISELGPSLANAQGAVDTQAGAAQPISHQYCWEFLADGGEIKAECKECITYRSRARRCYELKDLPGSMGCLNLLCDTECTNCEYYQAVQGQGINVLVLGRSRNLVRGLDRPEPGSSLRLEFTRSEYEAAKLIQEFRPDYIVIDCSFGKRRTAEICGSLFSDIRIPVARIILSSRDSSIRDYCDKEVFGWIRKPFSVDELRSCITGVPKLAQERA